MDGEFVCVERYAAPDRALVWLIIEFQDGLTAFEYETLDMQDALFRLKHAVTTCPKLPVTFIKLFKGRLNWIAGPFFPTF
jgi:hypothetical protein